MSDLGARRETDLRARVAEREEKDMGLNEKKNEKNGRSDSLPKRDFLGTRQTPTTQVLARQLVRSNMKMLRKRVPVTQASIGRTWPSLFEVFLRFILYNIAT